MGDRLIPPKEELFSPKYEQRPDHQDWWRNLFENPVTVQFDHRLFVCLSLLLHYLLLMMIVGNDNLYGHRSPLGTLTDALDPSSPPSTLKTSCRSEFCHGKPPSSPRNHHLVISRPRTTRSDASSGLCRALDHPLSISDNIPTTERISESIKSDEEVITEAM